MSESEYLIEKKSLTDSIDLIDKRLEEIEKTSSAQFTMSDDEFMKKASVFLMTNQLQEKRFINFDSFIRQIDPKIVQEFIRSVTSKIVIKDGRIMSIRFKNGIEHKFIYKS